MSNNKENKSSIEITSDGVSVNYTQQDKQSVLELIWSNLSNVQKANLISFSKTGKTINGNVIDADIVL